MKVFLLFAIKTSRLCDFLSAYLNHLKKIGIYKVPNSKLSTISSFSFTYQFKTYIFPLSLVLLFCYC